MLTLINLKSSLALIVFLLAFCGNVFAAGCKDDAMVCQIDTISHVSLKFKGSNSQELSPYESQLIDFIRLRLRNDMSFLKHEELSFEEYMKATLPSDKEKAYVQCNVSTASDSSYPIAIHVKCSLGSMGDYERTWGEEMEGEILSYTSSSGLLAKTKEMLSSAVESIAIEFFETQDFYSNAPPL